MPAPRNHRMILTADGPRSRRRPARTSAIVATIVSACLLVPGTASAAGGHGAAGIGDPYFPDYGNGGYDASHYDVDIAVDGATLSGTTTMTATATQRLTRFNLDFVLDTTSVTVNGKAATYTHDELHELVITPAKPIKKGATMTVVVAYSDEPASVVEDGFTPVFDTNPGMVIMGEPESAPWWMATNDHPRDKATYDIAVTVPSEFVGLTSGRHVGTDHHGDTDTWHWQQAQPTTGYLIFLAVGPYDVTTTKLHKLQVFSAIGAGTDDEGASAKEDFKSLPAVIEFLEHQFGTYHFDAFGGVVPNASLGVALETQTKPIYTPTFWGGGRSNLSVLVHENAHQWFGDNVSVHNWREIWMNEGFATWAEWRWDEEQGDATAAETLMSYYNSIPEDNPFWQTPIGDPGVDQIFGHPVYTRGAMTVQALRNRIGDKTIRKVFRKWGNRHEYSDSTTKAFKRLAERVSGEDLGGFFQHWVYDPVKPAKTKENGLKGFKDAADVADIRPTDLPGWAERNAETNQIIAAEAAAHRH